jgi:small GTP-binding protein
MNSIGVDFKLKNIEVDNKKVKLQIWDTAGQERFRTITTSYYKGAQAIVVVFDITDKDSFEHVKNWMADVDKFAKEGVLRILVGNKCDLEHKRQVSVENGKELASKYGIQFLETSAKETVNIEKLFEDATKSFLSKQVSTSSIKTKKPTDGINLDNNTNQNSGCC